uniref:PHD-type domain-containing protein n=1 Tax=Ditylenchus dipsaci TaxID=166011 RepID=A0A915D5K8_9BILA
MEDLDSIHRPSFIIGDSLDPSDIEERGVAPSQSENSGDPLKAKNVSKTPSRILTTDTTHIQIEPAHIIEYEWPLKSGESYFIQEQISQLLDVKSFKRKYPELSRRTVEPRERDYLLEKLNLGDSLAPHHLNHLTALRDFEVHDLMSTEYPAIYTDYQKCVADRIKQNLLEKQKELDIIKSDAKKMDELRKKAIKSAAEFNTELQTTKKSERKYFLDIQTSIIQSPANKWMRMDKESSKPSAYPVALIPGQYTSHFKRFEKLSRLPDISPPPIYVSEQELARRNAVAAEAYNQPSPLAVDSKEEVTSEKSARDVVAPAPLRNLRRSSTSSSVASAAKKTRKTSIAIELSNTLCSVCGLKENGPEEGAVTPFVKCYICLQYMHSNCIDMPSSMVDVVQKYNWSCIDCKMCDVCNKPDQEDAMMCCDLCDRGYHTFCVGLEQPPCGAWMCSNCEV